MSKLTKNEIASWIRNIIPYIENPVYLAPKGCFKGTQDIKAGAVIEYDATLMPTQPKIIEQQENLKALVELYKVAEDNQ